MTSYNHRSASNSKKTQRNSNHFDTQLRNGTYDVTFHTATSTVVEHVDGLLPVNAHHQLVYAKLGTDDDTWVAIMEKALTYFRNQSIPAAYSTINGGSGQEALRDLGGSTVTEALPNISNASQLFSDVQAAISANQATDIGTLKSGGGPLVNDHCYSVVGARVEIGVEQIEVRNPWGWEPGFVKNKDGFGATNDGYVWVKASSVLPELDEVVHASV